MNILLINLTIRANSLPFNFPIGLGIIAAVLRNAGYNVLVYDQNALRSTDEEMLAELKRLKEIDVVGVGGLITIYSQIKKLAPELRSIFKHAKLVLGGGLTIDPKIIFENIAPDFCIHGEGEHSFHELCLALENNDTNYSEIDGISFASDSSKGFVTTRQREIEKDLDKFPIPAYDLFPTEIYFGNNVLKNHMNYDVDTKMCATLMWSRGCPNQCSFCWRMMGKTVRFRSIGLVMEEIRYLRTEYGVDSYLFIDECINASRKHALEFATELIKNNLVAPWYSHARAKNFDSELAVMLKDSGCLGVNFGVESGNEEMLVVMNKKVTPQQAGKAVKVARDAGIDPICTFIIGMPGETERSVRDSINWILEHKTLKNVFFFATPYPGCDLFDMPIVQERIRAKYGSLEAFFCVLGDAADLTVNMTDLSDEQLTKLRNYAQKRTGLFAFHQWGSLLEDPKRIWRTMRRAIH